MITSYRIQRIAVDQADGSSTVLPPETCTEDFIEGCSDTVVWRLSGVLGDGRECAVADLYCREDAVDLYEAITGWRIPQGIDRRRGNEPILDLYATAVTPAVVAVVEAVAEMQHIRDIAEWTDAYPRLVAMARRIIREIDSRAA